MDGTQSSRCTSCFLSVYRFHVGLFVYSALLFEGIIHHQWTAFIVILVFYPVHPSDSPIFLFSLRPSGSILCTALSSALSSAFSWPHRNIPASEHCVHFSPLRKRKLDEPWIMPSLCYQFEISVYMSECKNFLQIEFGISKRSFIQTACIQGDDGKILWLTMSRRLTTFSNMLKIFCLYFVNLLAESKQPYVSFLDVAWRVA